jgi:hypothetical protein
MVLGASGQSRSARSGKSLTPFTGPVPPAREGSRIADLSAGTHARAPPVTSARRRRQHGPSVAVRGNADGVPLGNCRMKADPAS